MRQLTSLLTVLCVIMITGCAYDYKNNDTPTTGKLKIGIDDSYSLMMDSQIYTFESLYQYAKINATYKPEADVLQDLMNDTIQAAVISRDLTDAEKAFFGKKQRIVTTTKIAVDALAFIVNPENPDTNLTMSDIRRIFSGTDTSWSQLDQTTKAGRINIVFDNDKSCNARQISETLLDKKPFPSNTFAVKSNKEVIEYVNKNKNALGVISVSWISDLHDPTSQAFLKKIKVIGVSDKEHPGAGDYKKPYQAWIYEKTYPLRRDVYFIKTGLQESLGSGFASFVAGEKGQLIIFKMGMVPAIAPIRTIKITNE
jgi:phosphate transport system substrate-binding protein